MLKREDYKTIKRMDRKQMDEYLARVYRRGYDAGLKASKIVPAPVVLNKEPPEQESKA